MGKGFDIVMLAGVHRSERMNQMIKSKACILHPSDSHLCLLRPSNSHLSPICRPRKHVASFLSFTVLLWNPTI